MSRPIDDMRRAIADMRLAMGDKSTEPTPSDPYETAATLLEMLRDAYTQLSVSVRQARAVLPERARTDITHACRESALAIDSAISALAADQERHGGSAAARARRQRIYAMLRSAQTSSTPIRVASPDEIDASLIELARGCTTVASCARTAPFASAVVEAIGRATADCLQLTDAGRAALATLGAK